MEVKRIPRVAIVIIALLFCCGCFQKPGEIRIVDIKMATALDEQLMPVETTRDFPKGTSTVYCWFKWQNAKVGSEIMAKWHYVTDDIHVLDYSFQIPRKESAGGISLAMPEGKTLPSGTYRIDLAKGKRTLKSLTFKVE